mgnify:CR=1 FL=1
MTALYNEHDPEEEDKMSFSLLDFVRESNLIEGIKHTAPSELMAHEMILKLEQPTLNDLSAFVAICQPGAVLRAGGRKIRDDLESFLSGIGHTNWTPWRAHCFYETLRPYTDGNGRSGRVIWLWMMGGIENAPLGFLPHFYYQTLEETRK